MKYRMKKKSRFVGPASTNNSIPVNLKPGDHVFTESGRGVDVDCHHGIFVSGDRVIHFTSPTTTPSHLSRDACRTCGHTPSREGGVVKTCLDCFLGDDLTNKLLCVYEYGIRVSAEDTLEDWIKEKLNPQRVVYTRSGRCGVVNVGILLEDDKRKRVLHLRGPRLRVYSGGASPAQCADCGYRPTKKGGFFVTTCLHCFVGGSNNLFYIGEHGVPACRTDEYAYALPLPLANMAMDWWSAESIESLYHKILIQLLTHGIDVLKFFKRAEAQRRVQKLLLSPLVRKKTRNSCLAGLVDNSWQKVDAFTAHDARRIRFSDHPSSRSPSQVVAAAEYLLKYGFGKYHLKLNNCQHFATICRTGDVACTSQDLGVTGFVGPSCTNDRYEVVVSPKEGDHIFSERSEEIYFHHGICVGKDRVIHFTGPRKDGGGIKDICRICNHIPAREGKIVKTCLSCFLKGHSLYVYEYGIRVLAGDTLPKWIKDKLNPQRVIYTRSSRNGSVNIGILLADDKTVLHLRGPRRFVGKAPSPCANCDYKPTKKGGFVETCLQCFLRGNLLYIGEHGIPAYCRTTKAMIVPAPELHPVIHTPVATLFSMLLPDIKGVLRNRASNKDLYHQAVMQQLTKGIDVLKFTEQTSVQEFFSACPYPKSEITVHVDDSWRKFPAFAVNDDGRIQLHDQPCLKSPGETIKDANSLLAYGNGDYNLFSNNCEHLATTCKLGKPVCLQFRDKLEKAARSGVIALLVDKIARTMLHTMSVSRTFGLIGRPERRSGGGDRGGEGTVEDDDEGMRRGV